MVLWLTWGNSARRVIAPTIAESKRDAIATARRLVTSDGLMLVAEAVTEGVRLVRLGETYAIRPDGSCIRTN